MSIEVKNLLKVYGDQKAVNAISFRVDKGEIVGFLGPNGAGKSTTMKIITGYLQADGGSAEVCGINVNEDALAVKKKIGYLPELNSLYYDMYVREYLGFIAEVHGIGNRKARIEEVIDTTGLTLESSKKIGQLSKGYKQRVGLAAALIHDPEVLILDEPTTGLDPNQIIEIREMIRKQGQNKTVLFSSHILQEVEAICDRVIIINKGNLVANDTLNVLRQSTSSEKVVVNFKEILDPQWTSTLPSASGALHSGSGAWQISTNDPEKLRKEILAYALEHNLNIVSLQSDAANLEDVFRQLTTGSK